jgi:hypothetical protein
VVGTQTVSDEVRLGLQGVYETDHQDALKTCGDAYLKKPVCIADIQDSIAKLLEEAAKE